MIDLSYPVLWRTCAFLSWARRKTAHPGHIGKDQTNSARLIGKDKTSSARHIGKDKTYSASHIGNDKTKTKTAIDIGKDKINLARPTGKDKTTCKPARHTEKYKPNCKTHWVR